MRISDWSSDVCSSDLYPVGCTHARQTELSAERCGVAKSNAVMMLVGPSLRVVPITTHIALKEVPEALSIELIKARALATAKGLQKNFAIHSPRLVIAGLNPQAGEDGALGMEEIDIIIPAVEQLRAEGIDITGPLPADSLFHERVRGRSRSEEH